jgi:hypothetical protein
MQIRTEQLVSFQRAADERFIVRLRHELRTRQHDLTIRFTDVGLDEHIRAGMWQARAYGLTWERSLAAFIGFQLAFGDEFHKHPPMQAILADSSIPGDTKIDFLQQNVSARDWWECQQIHLGKASGETA